jgi:hypothetical protein
MIDEALPSSFQFGMPRQGTRHALDRPPRRPHLSGLLATARMRA